MAVWNQSWDEWRLWGPGYGWSTRYTAACKITVTRSIGSDTASVKVETTMTTPSGDTSLGDWQCIPTINGALSGGGEKNIVVASTGYHGEGSSYSATQTFLVGVGSSAGTLSGTVKFRIGGYEGYQGEYSESKTWSLAYDSKGTKSTATWSNVYWGKQSTITINRTVPDFRETVKLIWDDSTEATLRTYNQSGSDKTSFKFTIPYSACPTDAKTCGAKLRVITYSGDTQIGTDDTDWVTVDIVSGDTAYLPTLSNEPTCEAYNDVVAALSNDTAVANYSKINVNAALADVVCKYSASVASRVVTFSNGSSASAEQTEHYSSLIQSAGSISWTYTVTDTRGYTVTRSGNYSVINSSAPSITNVTVYRGDSDGTPQEGGAYIYATATASCESLNGHNSVTLDGKVGSDAYQPMQNGIRKLLKSGCDAGTQYVVTLKATDLLRPTTQTIIVPSSDIPVNIPPGKKGVGIGMKGTSDDTLKVAYEARFYDGIHNIDVANNNQDQDLSRAFRSLVAGYATLIENDSNLNTTALLKVGRYVSGNVVSVSTYTNCPTEERFSMEVFNATNATLDNETTGTWLNRVRRIVDTKGNEYIQECHVDSSPNNWTYGNWERVMKAGNTAITKITSFSNSDLGGNTDYGSGANWYRRIGNTVQLSLSLTGTGNSWKRVTYLPTGYRPPYSLYFPLAQTGYSGAIVYVGANGSVEVISQAAHCGGSITFLVN